MFDVAPTELLLIVVVAVLVIGPKELPRALYKLGQFLGKARGMARHFRTGVDAMVREAELEELQKQWTKQNEEIMARTKAQSFDQSPAPADAVVSDTAAIGQPELGQPDFVQTASAQTSPAASSLVEADALATSGSKGNDVAQQDLPLDAPDVQTGSRAT